MSWDMADEDLEDWARRFVQEAEEAGLLADAEEWEAFVASKLYNELGYEPTEGQFRLMDAARGVASPGLGFGTEYVTPGRPELASFRDLATGRFISRPDANYRLMSWKRAAPPPIGRGKLR